MNIISKLAQCTEGDVQLYHGMVPRYSNVRVCVNGTWNKICGSGNSVVNNKLASVICNQVGYSPYGKLLILQNILVL